LDTERPGDTNRRGAAAYRAAMARTRRRKVLNALAGIAAALVAVGAFAWFAAPGLLVVPGRHLRLWSSGVASRTVDVNGHAWPYLECGAADAPPVVLLHGFGTSKDAMVLLMPAIARTGFRAIAPDLPGFGDHPRHPGAHQDGAFYVRELGAFMDAVGASRAVMLGTSMGGAIGAEMAITAPERVQAVALLSPAGVEPPVRNAFMQQVDRGEIPLDIRGPEDFDRIMELVFLRPPPVPGPFRDWFVARAVERRADTLDIVESVRPLLTNGLDGRLGAIRAPMFVMYGTEDRVTDPSMLQVFQRQVPAARAVLVPDAGHVAFADNWPGVWAELGPFLAEVRAK
jgi:abhydrolase domain-containing protein 6